MLERRSNHVYSSRSCRWTGYQHLNHVETVAQTKLKVLPQLRVGQRSAPGQGGCTSKTRGINQPWKPGAFNHTWGRDLLEACCETKNWEIDEILQALNLKSLSQQSTANLHMRSVRFLFMNKFFRHETGRYSAPFTRSKITQQLNSATTECSVSLVHQISIGAMGSLYAVTIDDKANQLQLWLATRGELQCTAVGTVVDQS